MATFSRGDVYSERLLLDFQERLLKLGLFEGASVEVDANGPPEAAPVHRQGQGADAAPGHLRRRLQRQHRPARLGRALRPQGVRPAVDRAQHAHLRPRPEVARHRVHRRTRSRTSGATSLAANIEQLLSADETRDSWTARVGRSKDTIRLRAAVLRSSCVNARVESAPLTTSSNAPSGQLPVAAPRRRQRPACRPRRRRSSLQGGVGYGDGTRRSDPTCRRADERAGRSFAPTRAQRWYRPVGSLVRQRARSRPARSSCSNPIGVPDTILFRAGGDNSVRGYDYRTLGPIVNGAVVGGRVLLTGSVEFEHPLTDRLPQLLGAVFVDAGNAADRWREPASGVRLRRRRALPQPRRAAAPRRRLRPERSPGAPAPERRRRLTDAMTTSADEPRSRSRRPPRPRHRRRRRRRRVWRWLGGTGATLVGAVLLADRRAALAVAQPVRHGVAARLGAAADAWSSRRDR